MSDRIYILPGYRGADTTDRYRIDARGWALFELIPVAAPPYVQRAHGPWGGKITVQPWKANLRITGAISRRQHTDISKKPECGTTGRPETGLVLSFAADLRETGSCLVRLGARFWLSIKNHHARDTWLLVNTQLARGPHPKA